MKPLKRIEHFLAKIAGDSSAKELTPKTRDEYYLNEIAENGGGGGGALVVNITDESATHPDFIEYLVCDKTAKEMLDAMQKGIVQGVSGDEWKAFYIFFGATMPSDLDPGVRFKLLVPNQEDVVISMNFFAETEDDYPVHFEVR